MLKQKAQVWIVHQPKGQDLDSVQVLLFHLIHERGGFWQPVTGGVNEGEAVLAGALRELREETSFLVEESDLHDLKFRYRFHGKWGESEESVFVVNLREKLQPTLDPREHVAYEWLPIEEAKKRIIFPDQQHALILIEEKLKSRQQL